MSRLIDADKLIEDLMKIDTECIFDNKEDILEKALATVDIQSTIEAMPVIQGEWNFVCGTVNTFPVWQCSNCKERYFEQHVNEYNFCPNCGADMRKKVE